MEEREQSGNEHLSNSTAKCQKKPVHSSISQKYASQKRYSHAHAHNQLTAPPTPPLSPSTPTHLATRPQLTEQRIRPRVLPSSEPIHASISAVIHPVVDRVHPAAGASVLADRAAGRRSLLRRGVGDLVAGSRAAALEDVVEAQPVADFVGGGRTLVVGGRGAAGERVGEVDAAVEGAVGGGRGGGGEVAPARGGMC